MKLASLLSLVLGLFTTANANQNVSIPKLWSNYESWLESNYSAGITDLNKGATELQLKDLESKIKYKLPEKYRNWLEIHNGQKHVAAGLLVSGAFFSSDEILIEWNIMKTLLDEGKLNLPSESDPKGAINLDWWNTAWIPISGDGAGNLICLDMSPDKNGVVGQVIDFDHETVHRTVLANSFEQYITEYLADLNLKQYIYSDDYGQIIPIEDL